MKPASPRTLLVIFLVLIFALHYVSPLVHADTLTISFIVGDTRFAVDGWTSPDALVTVTENNNVLGTTSAGSDGSFEKTLTSQNPGLHEYKIHATDTESIQTSTVVEDISLSGGFTTTISNLVLPPTININQTSAPIGTALTVSGIAAPSSTITVFVNGNTSSTTSAGTDGTWSALLNTSSLPSGTTTIYATNTVGSYLSGTSTTESVTLTSVSSSPAPNTASAEPGVTSSPEAASPSPTETPVVIISLPSIIVDLLPPGTTKITVTNLYAVVANWVSNWTASLEPTPTGSSAPRVATTTVTGRCDLNRDGHCDVTDFSILIYYTGR